MGPNGRVFAFEPVPGVFRRLVENVEISGATNISTYQVALSDKRETVPFYLGRTDSMGSLYRPQTANTIEVVTERLDDFLDRHLVTRVDAVKIDAEGAEMRIVRGMRRLLARGDRPILLVEHNYRALQAAGSSAEELFHAILDQGYAAYLVAHGELRPAPTLAVPFAAGDEAYANYVFLPRATN